MRIKARKTKRDWEFLSKAATVGGKRKRFYLEIGPGNKKKMHEYI